MDMRRCVFRKVFNVFHGMAWIGLGRPWMWRDIRFVAFLMYSMVPGLAWPQPAMDMKRCFFRSFLLYYMVLGPAQRPGLAGQLPSQLASFSWKSPTPHSSQACCRTNKSFSGYTAISHTSHNASKIFAHSSRIRKHSFIFLSIPKGIPSVSYANPSICLALIHLFFGVQRFYRLWMDILWGSAYSGRKATKYLLDVAAPSTWPAWTFSQPPLARVG